MLCGVTATLGSNPSATATAARPHWGRAVLLCLDGVCTGAGLLDVPVGGGQPASRPREPWHRSLAFRTVGRPPHWWVFRLGLKDKKSWSEPDLSALRCEKVWFKVVGGQL